MAKNKKSRKRPPADDSAAVAVAGDDSEGRPASSRPQHGDDSADSAIGGGAPSVAAQAPGSGGFFQLYKPGQGYYVRMGTGLGGGVVLLGGALFLNGLLANHGPLVQLGLPALLFAAAAAALYWVAGVNRRSTDFFVATESEMKKVSWSTRREVSGSTKVVLVFTVVMSLFLFVVDVLFMLGFSAINVLQIDIGTLLGFGS